MGSGVGQGRAIEPLDPQPCIDAEIDPVDCAEPEPEPPCDPNTKDCFSTACRRSRSSTGPASGCWLRLPRLEMGNAYELADPERYVDPASGESRSASSTTARKASASGSASASRGRPVSGIVTAHGLVKRYDRTLAVAGLDLDVEQGEIFGLVGPNGAGKTTTLRILATLLEPTAGDAEIAGRSVRGTPTTCAASSGSCRTSSGCTTT